VRTALPVMLAIGLAALLGGAVAPI
jgi:hypothetical protein